MMTGMIVCAASLFAQATPGNAGADPGNSNGGSGIQTQPNINPNTLAPTGSSDPMSNSGYNGMKGSTGHTGTTGHKKRKKSKKILGQELYSPENDPMPK